MQMKCVNCSSIALLKSYGNFCSSPVHFTIGRNCVRSNCFIYRSVVKSTLPLCFQNCVDCPFRFIQKFEADIYILEILKSLQGFQVKKSRFLIIYRPLHVNLGTQVCSFPLNIYLITTCSYSLYYMLLHMSLTINYQ